MLHRHPHRHVVLAVGTVGQTGTCVFVYGLASLVPRLRAEFGLTLGQTGALVSTPVFGLLLTLVAWGFATDRFGERAVLATGLAGSGAMLCLAPTVSSAVGLGAVLAVAGAFGASVNAASGRVVLGYYSAAGRGTAMGVRQSAQPLGVALGAAVFPSLAGAVGVGRALLFPAAICLVAAAVIALGIPDPPPVAAAGTTASNGPGSSAGTVAGRASPYRDGLLARVHLASALLVVPQFATAAFAVAYLVSERGWTDVGAGRLMAVVSLTGAGARIVAGRWSDRIGSRLRPMRAVAVATAVATAALTVGAATGWAPLALGALVVATVTAASPNGLAFTAVAERAGSAWAGRALGVQNTGQNVTAVLVPPLLGALVGATAFSAAFAVAAVAPVAAAALVPVSRERTRPT